MLYTQKLFIFMLFCCLGIQQVEARSLMINVFTDMNGRGLELDQKILAKELSELGHDVYCRQLYEQPNHQHPADVNIFLQVINLSWIPHATFNWFIPNPEWFLQDVAALSHIDLILCRTKEVERIFQSMHQKTYFLGFTSMDCYQPEFKKNFSLFLHAAGVSNQKGTFSILDLWLRDPSLPTLIAIKHFCPFTSNQSNLHWFSYRVDEPTLRGFQNVCGVHLCPSETEGFGHYMMEAMSAGAVVFTTDAPPMNEFITDKRFLIPFEKTLPQYLGTNYYINADLLEKTLKNLATISAEELKTIGWNNRKTYLKKTAQFKERLAELLLKCQSEIESE